MLCNNLYNCLYSFTKFGFMFINKSLTSTGCSVITFYDIVILFYDMHFMSYFAEKLRYEWKFEFSYWLIKVWGSLVSWRSSPFSVSDWPFTSFLGDEWEHKRCHWSKRWGGDETATDQEYASGEEGNTEAHLWLGAQIRRPQPHFGELHPPAPRSCAARLPKDPHPLCTGARSTLHYGRHRQQAGHTYNTRG